ncbi:MAG: hypothetical protein NUW21_08000 [Elusimicrobia bacterium]|nr:hypothetical protein [Elusimicrobiota bacterium]
MIPPNNADQIRIVHKLAALRKAGTTGESFLAALEEVELEAMLWNFPDNYTEPLVLFALFTATPDEEGIVQEEYLAGWIKACATWLCLEWLRRRGALVSYTFNERVVSWPLDAIKLTSGFLADLERQHPSLHYFAAHVFRRAAPDAKPGAAALN